MKKVFFSLICAFVLTLLVGCAQKKELYVLNVGDYMNEELIEKFEKKYRCHVNYTEKGSNEEIYQTVLYDQYDVVVVSDYMIDRFVKEDRVEKIDLSKLSNYKESELFEDARNLLNSQSKDYKDYFIPYFWGTVGILYNTDVAGLKEYVESKGLGSVMEKNSYKVGMYNSARDALCLAALYNGSTDINTSDETILTNAKNTLKNAEYTIWGEDNLKEAVASGQLDLALVYSGDYLDQVYKCSVDNKEVNFAYYAPEVTNIWVDGLVVMKNAKNVDLAYDFINFLSDHANQAENADYIGYCPLNETVFNILYDEYEYDYSKEEFYPYNSKRLMYKFVSVEQYNKLNDLLEEAKQSK